GRAEIGRTRPEEVDTARERLLRGAHDTLAVSRAGAFVIVGTQATNGNRAGTLRQPGPELADVARADQGHNRVDVERGGAARRPEPVGARVQLGENAVEENTRRPAQHAADATEIRRHLG